MVITTVNVVIGYYLQSVERSSLASVMISLRSFVIFLSATFILGLLYGMNGIWAAYVVAEVITFLICLFVVCLKRNKLRKEGIYANMLLLDENVEKSTERFIYVHTSNYEDYIAEFAERAECIGEIENIKKYMCELGKGMSDKKDGCIESEINIIDKKVIIRDNLNHSTDLKNVVSLFNSAEKLDYGSVLGWNRFYLESRGEVR